MSMTCTSSWCSRLSTVLGCVLAVMGIQCTPEDAPRSAVESNAIAGAKSVAGRSSGASIAGRTNTAGASTANSGTGIIPSAGMPAQNNTATAGRMGSPAATGSGTPAVAGTPAVTPPPVVMCPMIAGPYSIASTQLDPSIVPLASGGDARALVAVDSSDRVFVAVNRKLPEGMSVAISAESAAAAEVLAIPNAVAGGLAATKDGLGVLLYDPAPVDKRVWAAVKRFDIARVERWNTELFHSPNLTDAGTKGNPTEGRLVYLAGTDELLAYFAHNEMIEDVRHQGGYLAALDAAGKQRVINKWFGSHNLEQRVIVDGTRAAVLGLGDAFPKGLFFSWTDSKSVRPAVIYRVAVSGNGAANGQLGDMVALQDTSLTSFITNRSVPQDLSAGDWRDIDPMISMQIRQAAASGVDAGLVFIAKSGAPTGDLPPTWLNLQPASGARIANFKTVPYGKTGLFLLAWSETTGPGGRAARTDYTMVVDRTGAVCQAKIALQPAHGFTSDDFVQRADGSTVWANFQAGRVNVVTLRPGT